MLFNNPVVMMVETDTLEIGVCGVMENVYIQHEIYHNGNIKIKRFDRNDHVFMYELVKVGKTSYYVKDTKIPMTWRMRKGEVIIVGIRFRQTMKIKNIVYTNGKGK